LNEIEKANAEFDEKIIIDKSICYFCKIKLNENNSSMYRLFFEEDNEPCIGALCLKCREVWERLEKTKNIKPEIELEIRQQVYEEGWTDEMLRAKEEREFAVLN